MNREFARLSRCCLEAVAEEQAGISDPAVLAPHTVTGINLKPRTFVLALGILLFTLSVALILQAVTGSHIAGWVAFVLGFIALLGRYWM